MTMDELKKLKLKLITHWTEENFIFLARLYKGAEKNSSY